MAKLVHIQDVEAVSNDRGALHTDQIGAAPIYSTNAENTNGSSQLHLKLHFTDGKTGATSPAKRSQFVKPGFIAQTGATSPTKRSQFVKPGFIAQTGATSPAKRSQFVKPGFIAQTSATSPAKKGQFVKPGFVDAGHSAQFSKSETSSQIESARVRSRPLRPTQKLRPSWSDDISSLETSIHPSLSSEPDKIMIDARKTLIVPSTEESFYPLMTRNTAKPPYERSRYTLETVARQYIILLRVLLAEYRTTWLFHVFGGLLIPLGFVFFIGALGTAASSERATYLLGGNMALSITTGPTSFLITKIGSARQSKEFHYWVALPIMKVLLVLAIISVALLFALPGLLGTYLFGSLLLGLPFEPSSWILLALIPLGVLPLAGLGALLGLFAQSDEVASIFSNLLVIFVGILSPIIIPLESLPVPLRIISQFMPTTHAADAFRAVIGGYPGTNLAFDILVLVLFSAGFLTIMYLRLDWRNS